MSRDSSGLWAPIEAPPPAPELSVVVPLRDEEASVPLLADEVEAALDGAGLDWECIWVDDGSRDGSRGALEALARRRPEHRWIGLAPGVGQSGALVAGFREARAPLLATLDADLQNDPADLPRLLEALGDGDVDMVNGVRAGRRDTWVRRVSSRIANGFRNRVTGESVTDVGCAVRVFRADLVAAVPAFRGMHRFLPTLLRLRGARIVEVPVAHRPRRTGRTHYGIHNRLWVGLLDTFGVWWLKRRWVEPRPAARSPVAASPRTARRCPGSPRPAAGCATPTAAASLGASSPSSDRVPPMQVLLVEDDADLRRIVAQGLAEEGVSVAVAADYREGLEQALFSRWDVVVLDILLPGGSGLDICRRIRDGGDATPILLLTSRDAVRDRVEGLECGADDYLTKPFAFEELVARVRALARRSRALLPEEVVVGDLRVDLRSRRVRRAGKAVRLTNKEWDLLEVLVRNADAVLDRATLTGYVWDDNHDPAGNALEVLVRRLRAKIDDPFERPLVHTVRGAGYRIGP